MTGQRLKCTSASLDTDGDMERNGKKIRSPQRVLKSLLALRDEMDRYRYDWTTKRIAAQIDQCLHDVFELRQIERNDDD